LGAGLTKDQIRSKILLKLKIQKEEDREKKSKIIKEKLFNTLVFKKAKTVMFYVSFSGEVKTEEMIKEAQNLGKIIAVPACSKDITLKPCRLGLGIKLVKGPYGVCEPQVKRAVPLKDLDLVIVPAVAFDKKGNRIGRGKGYYDRFLKKIPARTFTIGLAFNFQILPALPATEQDVSVQKVIFA
jgi:5-formyltetrahydrofolate cyclo-ligase